MPKTHEVMTRIGFKAGLPKRPRSILTRAERAELAKAYQEWLRSSPNAELLEESGFLRVYGWLYFEKLAGESKRFREQLDQLKALGASIGDPDAQ